MRKAVFSDRVVVVFRANGFERMAFSSKQSLVLFCEGSCLCFRAEEFFFSKIVLITMAMGGKRRSSEVAFW